MSNYKYPYIRDKKYYAAVVKAHELIRVHGMDKDEAIDQVVFKYPELDRKSLTQKLNKRMKVDEEGFHILIPYKQTNMKEGYSIIDGFAFVVPERSVDRYLREFTDDGHVYRGYTEITPFNDEAREQYKLTEAEADQIVNLWHKKRVQMAKENNGIYDLEDWIPGFTEAALKAIREKKSSKERSRYGIQYD